MHQDLQILCLPYEINVKDLYYKLYSYSNTSEDIQTEAQEDTHLSEEFCIDKLSKLAELTETLLNDEFELLVDYLYSTNSIVLHANASLKSLTKLAFNYLLESDFSRTLDILDEILDIMMEGSRYDRDFYTKMKQLKDKVQQISLKQ